jgi:alkylated DNA repair dioxygenase AlkB
MSTTTRVVKLQRKGGEVIQDCDVYIGRAVKRGGWDLDASKWGNPFGPWDTPEGIEEIKRKYKTHVLGNKNLMNSIHELQGKILGCWCHPKSCHGDVLVEILKELEEKQKQSSNSSSSNSTQKRKFDLDDEEEEETIVVVKKKPTLQQLMEVVEQVTQKLPPGLELHENFVTEEEEKSLLKSIDRYEWDTTLKRRTQHYGFKYDYKNRSISKDQYLGPLPPWNDLVVQRMIEKDLVKTTPEQAIVNEYEPGQGISAHTDSGVFGEPIVSLSLGSDCVMIFSKGDQKVELFLKRRTLLILRGESRWYWKHEIPQRKTDTVSTIVFKRGRRVSVTYRYLKNKL